jgi:serine/threonine-protein kinase
VATGVLEPGSVLADKYRIEALIGEGGMGKVYRANRLTDGRAVAVKLVRGGEPATLARFAREAELVARITHPNVVGILDFGIASESVLFLVMELVDGQSLDRVRDRFGDLPWALPMVAQLAAAIEAIHALGVVHRDVKPANVLVAGEVLKLTDFGVAHVKRVVDAEQSGVSTLVDAPGTQAEPMDPSLTRAGTLIGSPLYMAPELSAGAEHASPRSDLFSFGLVAYELLSGQLAYDRPLVTACIQGGPLPAPPPPLASLVPGLPVHLAAIVDDCLHVSPDARPPAATVARLFAGPHVLS